MHTPDFSRAVWRLSSYTGGNGDCVEIAQVGRHTAVRDSKNPDGPKLMLSTQAVRSFLDEMKAGKYDL